MNDCSRKPGGLGHTTHMEAAQQLEFPSYSVGLNLFQFAWLISAFYCFFSGVGASNNESDQFQGLPEAICVIYLLT